MQWSRGLIIDAYPFYVKCRPRSRHVVGFKMPVTGSNMHSNGVCLNSCLFESSQEI